MRRVVVVILTALSLVLGVGCNGPSLGSVDVCVASTDSSLERDFTLSLSGARVASPDEMPESPRELTACSADFPRRVDVISADDEALWIIWRAILEDDTDVSSDIDLPAGALVNVEVRLGFGLSGIGNGVSIADDDGLVFAADSFRSEPIVDVVSAGETGFPHFTSCSTISELSIHVDESTLANGQSANIGDLEITNVASRDFGGPSDCEDVPTGTRLSWIATRSAQ